MLISERIERLCEERRLFRVEPLDWRGGREQRTVYVSRDLYRFIELPSTDPATNAERRRLQRLFDRFILGQEVSVTFGRRTRPSHIKRLSKSAEVWEFKIRGRRAKHQARVFGRFAQADVFLALTGPVDRLECDYESEIARCQRQWDVLLPEHSPVYGNTIDDYISTKAIPL
jgi:hypothetical protein